MQLDHPYRDLAGGTWLRGNLHTHTNHSDGDRPTQQVIDDYAARGYGFVMISDHDIYTSADKLQTYTDRGMVLIPGNEVTANGPHMLDVHADGLVEPDAARQQVIDRINAGRGFCIVNHPNWKEGFDHCPLASLVEWTGYTGMEIYNGVISRLEGSPYATNKWDMLLAAGRRIWGFANDDSHALEGDVELGWNTAYVTDRSAAGVVAALRKGRFYASTGVTIEAIEVSGMSIRIVTRDARRIVALADYGRRIAVVDEPAIQLTAPDDGGYIRFECWGDGERFAWTQPFFVVR